MNPKRWSMETMELEMKVQTLTRNGILPYFSRLLHNDCYFSVDITNLHREKVPHAF